MTARTVLRTLAVLGVVGSAVVLTALPAAALTRDDGDDPGVPPTAMQTLAVFIGIPALVIVTIWLLWSLPGWIRRDRTRPGVGWYTEPSWFGEVEGDTDTRPALPSGSAGESGAAATTSPGGGAHARW